MTLTVGNRHDVTQPVPLVDAFPLVRRVRARPRLHPGYLYADRGYDYDVSRRALRDRGITPRIARSGVVHGSGLGRTRWVAPAGSHPLGRTRWVVERSFAWLHPFKRLRIRYEVRPDLHLGLLQLACALICHSKLPAV